MNAEQKSLFWRLRLHASSSKTIQNGPNFCNTESNNFIRLMPVQINTKRSIINFKWWKRFLMKKKHPNVVKNNQEGSRKMRQGRGSWTSRSTEEVVKRLGLINQRFQRALSLAADVILVCARQTVPCSMFECRMLSEQVTVHEHNLRHSRTRIWLRTAA